jgi:hypothetical protein
MGRNLQRCCHFFKTGGEHSFAQTGFGSEADCVDETVKSTKAFGNGGNRRLYLPWVRDVKGNDLTDVMQFSRRARGQP